MPILKFLGEYTGPKPDEPDKKSWTPLHYAAQKGDANLLTQMLRTRPNINVQNSSGCTPLHVAVMSRNLDCVNVLLRSESNVYKSDNFGMLPIHYVAESGDMDILKKFTAIKGGIDFQDKKGRTPLHVALVNGNIEAANEIISAGPRLDVQNLQGVEPLHIAIEKGYDDVVKKMLDAKPYVNVQNRLYRTALHIALLNEKLNYVEDLLNAGANLNMQDTNGHCPLHIAVEKGFNVAVGQLIGKNPDVNLVDNYNRTPLHVALINENLECAHQLLEAGSNIEIQDFDRLTPMHIAAKCGYKSIWKKMLSLKPHLNENIQVFKLLQIVLVNERLEYLDDLLEIGVKLDVKDAYNRTVIHVAVGCKSDIILRKLLDFKLDINLKDNQGQTPLHIACRSLKFDYIALLLDSGARWDIRDKNERLPLSHLIESLKNNPQINSTLAWVLYKINDGDAINDDKNSAAHSALEYHFQGKFDIELLKLIISTQKKLNMEDKYGFTPINYIVRNWASHDQDLIISLIKFFIELGAYLTRKDVEVIAKQSKLLQDIDFCTQCIVNEFNNGTLVKFYSHLPKDLWIGPLNAFKITLNSQRLKAIEENVQLRIEQNGYCDVCNIVPTSLAKQCVETYCHAFVKPPSRRKKRTKK